MGPPGLALRSSTSCLGPPGRGSRWRLTSCLATLPAGRRSNPSSPGYATKKSEPPPKGSAPLFWAHQDLVSSRPHRVVSLRPASAPKTASCRFALPVRSRRRSGSSPAGSRTKKSGRHRCGTDRIFWAHQDLNCPFTVDPV